MSKATILIVEDDAILAMYLQEIITLMGYTAAKPLASGEEALVFLADNPVDLVLMDIELAGRMNGIDTAEAISRTSDVPIIFLTGYSHDPLLEQAKIAAPYGYLIKPVPERELAATLSMALHRYALDKQLKESRIALARSEARYRHLFENSPLGIFRTTLEGKPLALNAEMAKIVGCATPEEAIADFKDLAKNLYVDPERRQEFIRQLQDNGSVQHFVYEGRKKTGETIWISMNAKLTAADEENGEQSDPVIDGFAVDITDTKRAEEALRESETTIRKKLQVILEPEGDLSSLELADIINAQALQTMMEKFYRITKIGIGILDIHGRVLVGVGWQDVCTKFHRHHPESLKNCQESDIELSSDIPFGTYKAYRCKNNMWDLMTPIEIGGRHLGNVCLGQFFYEDETPDYELFREQAHTYAFDEKEYLEAIGRVPRWSQETVKATMEFYASLSEMISSLSYSAIKLSRTISEKDTALRQLEESRVFQSSLLEAMPVAVFYKDSSGRYIGVNQACETLLGKTREDLLGKTVFDIHPPELARIYHDSDTILLQEQGSQIYDSTIEDGQGKLHDVIFHKAALTDSQGTVTGLVGAVLDISERKETEEALRKSEETHRALVESLPDVVMRFDKEGRHLFVSENVSEVIDLPAADFIGKTHRELGFTEKLCKFWEESIQGVFDSGKPFEGESRFKGRLGTVIHNWRLVPELDAQGRIQSVLSLSRDITAIRQAEQNYQTLFNEMLDGFALHQIICDERGMPVDYRFLAVNPAFERMTGLKAADIIGRTVLEILPGTEPHWIETYGNVALSGQPRHFENISADLGKHFEVTAFQPAPGQFACIFVDVTERKRAELELQSKETHLRTLFDESPMGISSSRDGIMLNANKKYLSMFGYKNVSELQGEPLLEHIAPQCRKEMADRIARRARGEQVETLYETVGLRKDGSQFPFMVSVDRINLQEGLITFSFLTDITDRKRAEAEHKQLQAQLQQAQKMEAIGTLAGGIAHDFNNILGAILGYAEMALDDCPAGSMAANDVGQVIKAGHRARELVKQILAFSRQAETEHVPLQPATIIKEAIKMLRSSLPSTITIEQDIDKDAGPLFADPTQIHQILMNLCTNAFHAMETTGGILSISLKEKNLSRQDLTNEPQAEPGNFVHLSVSDTGAGIPPEIRERIFDPYFTTKETGKGTGMGLSIVHGIVRSYGGFISCHSEPGQGTIFQVFLPVMTEINLPAEMAEEPLQLGNERILFIDDEEMLVEMGRNLLERLGYRVTVRTSSLDALTTFQNQPDQFDLVITDQTMPGMTGSDLARRMLQIRPDLPIILCTGFSNLISAEKARSLGIKGFSLKPLAKKDIATLIRKVLDDGRLVGSNV